MTNTHHVCFSGSLACSGPNPCRACADLVNQHVLAFAMHGYGMTREQGQVFFAWITEGWRRLHMQMKQDPNIMQRALDVSRVRIEPLPLLPPTGLQAPGYVSAPLPPPAPLSRMAPSVVTAPASPPMPPAPLAAPFVSAPPTPEEMMAAIDPRLLQMLVFGIQQTMQDQMQAMQEQQDSQEQEQEQNESQQLDVATLRRQGRLGPPDQELIVFPESVGHAEPSLPVPPDPLPPPAPPESRPRARPTALANVMAPRRDSSSLSTARNSEMTVEDVVRMASPVDVQKQELLQEPLTPGESPELNGAPRS